MSDPLVRGIISKSDGCRPENLTNIVEKITFYVRREAPSTSKEAPRKNRGAGECGGAGWISIGDMMM